MDKMQDTIDILKQYNQDHVIKLLKKQDENKREELINKKKNII